MMKLNRTILAAGVFAAFAAVDVGAVPVTPLSYTFNPEAQVGTYIYHDETGRQLTDGQFGPGQLNNSADAYPYVGWLQKQVTINFLFDGVTAIDTVTVSSLQAWIGNIVLPDVYVRTSTDGQNWTDVASLLTPESTANNYQNIDLVLSNLNLDTQFLQLQLKRNNVGPWIFVDEVTFEANEHRASQVQAVPEVGSTLSLLGLALGGMLGVCRWTRIKS
jgi:hypothetical protein